MKILLSDIHEQPFREEKFKTQKKDWIESFIQFFADKKREEPIEKIKRIIEEQEVDVVVTNGDLSESSATERGMNSERDFDASIKVLTKWSEKLKKKIRINGGNHEFGYDLPLSSDPQAGIRRESVSNFLKLAGWDSIYHSELLDDGYKIIFVPYIFSEESAYDFDIKDLQKIFLLSMEQDLKANSHPAILFIHDPDSFDHEGLTNLIRDYKNHIKIIFYGHYHSWVNLLGAKILIAIFNKWWLIAIRPIISTIFYFLSKRDVVRTKKVKVYFQKRKNVPKLIKEFGAILIPAPNGMFGIGGGFLTLDLRSDGSYKIEKHKI
jgi:predicted phosphodiesterase